MSEGLSIDDEKMRWLSWVYLVWSWGMRGKEELEPWEETVWNSALKEWESGFTRRVAKGSLAVLHALLRFVVIHLKWALTTWLCDFSPEMFSCWDIGIPWQRYKIVKCSKEKDYWPEPWNHGTTGYGEMWEQWGIEVVTVKSRGVNGLKDSWSWGSG